MLTRRRMLTTAAGLMALPPLRFAHAAGPAPIDLVARERSLALLPRSPARTPIWAYADDWPLVLRLPRGETFRATLHNELAEHTTIHWHGLRIPLAMDGVP